MSSARPQTGPEAADWLADELRARPPRRIFAPGREHIGDIVNLTGPLLGLRERFPNAFIVAEVGERTLPLLEGFPAADEIWARPTRQGVQGKLERLMRLRRGGFDLAVLLDDSNGLVLEAKLAGIPRRVGIWRGKKHKPLFDAYVPLTMNRHDVRDHGEALLMLLGLPPGKCSPALFPSPERVREAEVLAVPRPSVGLQLGSSDPRKRVPLPHLAEVARTLSASGCHVVLVGSSDEQPLLDELEELTGLKLLRLRPDLHLLTLGGVLAKLDLLICHDSGPMHLAAVMGGRVLALYGPTYPSHTRPWGERAAILQEACHCPLRHWTTCPGTCLAGLTPDRIVAAAKEILDGA
jgi:ADP-heptose:LPS heptosyltransferase